jgi:flagellar P-ring protein precursor FlgI
VTGGFAVGRSTNSQTVNHPTAGRIPGGAIVERSAPTIEPSGRLKLQLHQPDFTTALRVSAVVNEKFGVEGKPPLAHPENSAVIAVTIPAEYATRAVEFIAALEALQVQADRPARVVINERTGTIVMGKEVRVSPVAIMHGKLTVEIQTVENVSQPNPLSQGSTTVVPETTVGAKEEKARSLVLKQGATVEELVRALGAIGSTPRDVIGILQSLRAAGALEADIDVI